MADRKPIMVDHEWGTFTFVGVCVSTILMTLCSMVTFDLVRSMWAFNDPSSINKPLLDMMKRWF